MRVIIALTVLTYGALLVASISALLLTVSFTRVQRKKFTILRSLDGKKLHLAAAALFFLLLGYGAYIAKEIVTLRQSLEPANSLSVTLKATSVAFNTELRDQATGKMNSAAVHFLAAEDFFRNSRFSEAAREYQESVNDLPTKAASLNLGIMLSQLANYEEASRALLRGIDIQQQQQRPINSVDANLWLQLATVRALQGRDAEARTILREAWRRFEDLNDQVGFAGSHMVLGNIFLKSNPLAAEREFGAAVQFYKREGMHTYEAVALQNLAAARYQRGEFRLATSTLLKALSVLRSEGNVSGQAVCLNTLGAIAVAEGANAEAERYFWESQTVAREHGLKYFEAISLVNSGHVAFEQKKYVYAISVAQRAYLLGEEIDNLSIQGGALLVKAGAELELKRYSLAIADARASIERLEKAGETVLSADAHSTLGVIFFRSGDLEASELEANTAITIAVKHGLKVIEASTRANLADVYRKRGRLDMAMTEATVALRLAKQAGLSGRLLNEITQLNSKIDHEMSERNSHAPGQGAR
jgi:tetratricopeptide (TPR) repeat protein